MKKIFFLLLLLSLGLYASPSSAQIFDIKVTDYDGADTIPALKTFIDEEIQKIRKDINGDLPGAQPDRLMEGMANSSVMAGKGVGTDYASNMKVMLIGAGIGVGADLEKDKTTDSDLSGAAVAPGIVIGANLGFVDAETFLGMDTNRLNMYVNFMSYSHQQQLEKDPEKQSEAKIDMLSLGVHFRYDWIKGSGSKLLGWGGVKFHFGYEYNANKINFNAKLSESIDETDSNGNNIKGTIRGNPQGIIDTVTHSIPLELSTDVQLLYFLSLYTGVGVDANFGSSVGKADLNAEESTVSCTNTNPTQACSTQRDIKVQALANLNAEGKVKPFTSRAFAGVQFNLPYLRIFGQVNKSFGDEVIGATAGLRFAF